MTELLEANQSNAVNFINLYDSHKIKMGTLLTYFALSNSDISPLR